MEVERDNKSQLLDYATRAGLLLGLFWVFKYLFVIFGANNPVINSIGSMLSLGTPFLLFYLLVTYNTKYQGDKLAYWQGVRLSVLLFFFASILETLIVFVHIQWIDPAFIANLYESMIEIAETLGVSNALVTRLSEQPLPDPFTYIFSNVILANVFSGLLLSLFIVPLASRYKQA